MESATNIHFQFQLQEQLARYYSIATQSAATHKVSVPFHDCYPSTGFLNSNMSNNRNYHHHETISSSSSGSEPWASINGDHHLQTTLTSHDHQFLLENYIKEEISDYSFLKLLTEINAEDSLSENLITLDHQQLSDHQLSGGDHHHHTHDLQPHNYNNFINYFRNNNNNNIDVSTPTSRSLLYNSSNTTPGYYTNNNDIVLTSELSSTYDHHDDDTGRNSSRQSSSSSTQRNLGGLSIRSSEEIKAVFMESDERDSRPTAPSKRSCTKLKMSALESGGGRKRSSTPSNFTAGGSMEFQGKAKKYRSTPRSSSCPPLKVRKEKLGDRIAALHKLVAPFSKTDTASVLTEAIGYIQFLHDQIQTLSVPYMKTFHKSQTRTLILSGFSKEDEKGDQKADLRSRGLCLVPLSCASFFNLYNCNGL